MAFLKVSYLVLLITVGVVLSEDIKSGIQNSVDVKDDLEGAETIGIAKKLLLIKGLGLGGLALASQKSGFGEANSLDYPAPVAYAAPAPIAYSAPAQVTYSAPAPVVYQAPAQVAYQVPAPVTYQAPAPVTYQAPAPVAYQAPAPVTYQAPAPVTYQATAPVADVPVSSGYTGNLQLVGYLSPVQTPQAVSYSNQVSSGFYNVPPPPPPPPSPIHVAQQPALLPCEH